MNKTDDACLPPEEIVGKYYHALYSGDLASVKKMMTEESYMMTLEPFGMKLSFKDPVFKSVWDNIEENEDSLFEVEKKISLELLSRNLSPQIDIGQIEQNGSQRTTVHYEEDGKSKKLYFSKKDGHWFIDYFAGRTIPPTPESYFSFIKNWIKSIVSSLK